jgi:hypothetical protein
MKFDIKEPEMRGSGRITDRKTGKVTHFWIGTPEAVKEEPKDKGESNADPLDQRP